jgi:hypothetical protein
MKLRALIDEFECRPHAGGFVGEFAVDGKKRGEHGERGACVDDAADPDLAETAHGTLPFEGMRALSD